MNSPLILSVTECRICEYSLQIIDYFSGLPLAGSFPTKVSKSDLLFSYALTICAHCKTIQTNVNVPSDILFKDYRYQSSISLSEHFLDLAWYIKEKYPDDPKILEIGSNDGVLLEPLKELGMRAEGVDPSFDMCKIAKSKGLNVLCAYFTGKNHGESQYDLVVSSNCLAHISDLYEVMKAIKKVLKPSGHLIMEVHYVRNILEQIQYDNIYIEHIYYHSITSLRYLMRLVGMTIIDFEELDVHAGSIRVTIENSDSIVDSQKIKDVMAIEKSIGLTDIDGWKPFIESKTNHINDLRNLIQTHADLGDKIVGYGASGRTNTLLNILYSDQPGVGFYFNHSLEYVIDESPQRYSRYIPGVNIRIYPPSVLDKDHVDLIVIFAWNYAKTIMKKLAGRGYKFLIPFPEPRIVEHVSEIESMSVL